MNESRVGFLAMLLSGCLCGQAMAEEYHVSYNAAGTATVNISTVNSVLAVNHNRVVHGLIITNNDAAPVTVTFSKLTNTVTTKTTGTGKNATSTSSTSSTTPVTEAVIIVPANSTQVIGLQSGLHFLRSKNNVADEMDVELTTTSGSPSVDLTIDYQDVGS
ncbi:MAG: hypothetical protein PHW13_04150 [Methylococcales bacterium]|nr:hypothetical protein [Methylococcales bacterium]